MKVAVRMVTAILLMAVVACSGDEGVTSRSGNTCTNIGQYSCTDNWVHLCRFDSDSGAKNWEARTNCDDSPSGSDCTCTIVQGLGICAHGGDANNPCK